MNGDKHIGFEVKTLSNLIKRCFEEKARMKELEGLTGMQGWIISFIYRQGEGKEVFQRDIEKEFNIRRSTATGVLQLMERDGLITRESVEHDARLKSLKLTAKAIQSHQTILGNIDEIEERLVKGLTQEEVSTFFELIERIKKNVE